MSWADKAHRKHDLEKAVEAVMKDRRFDQVIKQSQEDAYKRALDLFLLITVDYLFRTFRCKKDGILKYIGFFCEQINYAKDDGEYIRLLNSELVRDTGVNVIQNRVENVR